LTTTWNCLFAEKQKLSSVVHKDETSTLNLRVKLHHPTVKRALLKQAMSCENAGTQLNLGCAKFKSLNQAI